VLAGHLARAVVSREEVEEVLPLLAEHYESLSAPVLRARLDEVRRLGWRCEAMYSAKGTGSPAAVAVTGYWITTRICYGKFLYVDHFIVGPGSRRLGVGVAMMEHLHRIACEEGCERIVLDAHVGNDAAHAFWFERGFKIVGLHFGKSLRRG